MRESDGNERANQSGVTLTPLSVANLRSLCDVLFFPSIGCADSHPRLNAIRLLRVEFVVNKARTTGPRSRHRSSTRLKKR